MTFRVSDLGITRLNQTTGEKSTVGYVSYNERMNKNPVRKVDAVSSATSKQRSVVSATTPAYTVSFTSESMSALKSFKSIRDASKNLEQVKETQVKSSQDERLNSLNATDRSRIETQQDDRFKRADIYKRTDNKENGQERMTPVKRNVTADKTGTTVKTQNQSYRQAQAIKAYENQMSFASRKQTKTMFA